MKRRLIAVKDSQCEKIYAIWTQCGGNTMAVYTMGDNSVNNGAVTLQEQHLYGSSRLGIQKPGLEVSSLLPAYSTEVGTTTKSIYSIFERGKKFFELSNHLGNVLATVSDKKYLLAANSTGNGGCAPGSAAEDVLVSLRGTETVYTGRSSVSLLPGFESSGGDNFEVYTDAGLSACNPATDNSTATSTVYAAEVVSAQDYAPFGMELVGRQYNASSYRYGFNGKENDADVKGEGNQIDYGMRVYDPRLGRFLSVDPLAQSYPWNSPFSYSEGDPINYVDIDGAEKGGQTAQSAVRPTLPEISNVRVNPNGSLTNTTQLINGPINSGAYAPQSKFISQQELNDLIPPNAGASINPDGISMTVEGPNGAWQVSLLKPIESKRQITWVDRLILGIQAENNKQFNINVTQWNVSVQAYEIITTDPSTLTDNYLREVNRRLLNGTATDRDKLYAAEVAQRKNDGKINDPDKVSFIQGRGDRAIKRTVDVPNGYKKTNLKSHGQPVFTNGKNWITPDQDGHNGGVWKMFDKEKNVGSTNSEKRVGTFDANLKNVGK